MAMRWRIQCQKHRDTYEILWYEFDANEMYEYVEAAYAPGSWQTSTATTLFSSTCTLCTVLVYKHRWASTSISMSAISDIRHQHLLFRYRRQICRTEKHHSDIRSVPISTSEFIPISNIEEKIYIFLQNRTRAPWNGKQAL
jgi:hypothetical protein